MIIEKIKHAAISFVRLVFSEIVHTELVLQDTHNKSLLCTSRGVTDEKWIDEPLVVSLTTFGKRIMDVYLVVESIMQQTVKPNRIILWLDETEFDDSRLPVLLKRLCSRGLEIRYCPNIRSYKKIIPTLKLAPEATIVTIDDDVVYPLDFLEKLVDAYKDDKKCVYFYRGRYIDKRKKGLAPYGSWKMVKTAGKRMDILPTGIGGVMYPQGCFADSVLDESTFMDLCPKADDIWLRAMTILKEYPCCLIEYPGRFRYSFVNIDRNQGVALSNKNFLNGENDKQLKKTFSFFNVNVD